MKKNLKCRFVWHMISIDCIQKKLILVQNLLKTIVSLEIGLTTISQCPTLHILSLMKKFLMMFIFQMMSILKLNDKFCFMHLNIIVKIIWQFLLVVLRHLLSPTLYM
eukprot:c13278_g1_i1.p3 GENE.c13278_g1_i1~~c13278_g1_i1.p3  ORF type:complete len:107 (+),score=4.14 c13278_g1_i1:734-1054(+)